MMKIMTAVEYMQKELKHAYAFLDYAIEAKHSAPELTEVYVKIAENEAANAEAIHTIVIRMVDKASLESNPPQGMKDVWAWKHKEYIEEYSQFKAKLDALKRL
jgi:regulatory protein YycH of two-component signal transduction system YycFG